MEFAEMYDGAWVIGIFAVIIWLAYTAHMRRCDESGEQGSETH